MRWIGVLIGVFAVLGGCAGVHPGGKLVRQGDEIVVCGQMFHTGAPVVLWMDPGGYDAYRVERRFVAWEKAGWEATEAEKKLKGPERFGLRYGGASPSAAAAEVDGTGLSAEELERVRGGGWDLPTLQRVVDQFVLHYDVCGTSRTCFRVLHDVRGLSVHFMLDIDGTIYQTLDVKERAWHATVSNDRSVGIEIANIGAYQKKDEAILKQWYERDGWGRTVITLPASLDGGGVRTPGKFRPAQDEPVIGMVQGIALKQYDLTPQQYESLTRLTATLCTVLPRVRCDYPRDEEGKLVTHKLDDARLAAYSGVLGHYHIQANKTDPGPALDWERVVEGARRMMR